MRCDTKQAIASRPPRMSARKHARLRTNIKKRTHAISRHWSRRVPSHACTDYPQDSKRYLPQSSTITPGDFTTQMPSKMKASRRHHSSLFLLAAAFFAHRAQVCESSLRFQASNRRSPWRTKLSTLLRCTTTPHHPRKVAVRSHCTESVVQGSSTSNTLCSEVAGAAASGGRTSCPHGTVKQGLLTTSTGTSPAAESSARQSGKGGTSGRESPPAQASMHVSSLSSSCGHSRWQSSFFTPSPYLTEHLTEPLKPRGGEAEGVEASQWPSSCFTPVPQAAPSHFTRPPPWSQWPESYPQAENKTCFSSPPCSPQWPSSPLSSKSAGTVCTSTSPARAGPPLPRLPLPGLPPRAMS
mmetsp:Transcript_23229/g.34869  ORF Transcript_23229/g.34869 Transcript_23229/m.34869 type:complete len:354 (+) Transcript_23229:203-1264(+)